MPNVNVALDTFEKSVNLAFAGGVPSSLLARQDLEAMIVKLSDRETPLRDVLTRIKGEGRAHLWNQRTSLDAVPQNLTYNLFYADGDLPIASDPAYVQQTAAYKYLGVTGVITGPMIASGRSYTDIEAEIAEAKLRQIIQGEEWALFHGNKTTNPLMFDGLDAQLTTNVINKSGGAIAITDLDKAVKLIRLQGGRPTHVFCSYGVQNQINSLLLGDVRYMLQNGNTVTAGIHAQNYQSPAGVMPIVGDFFINPAAPYPWNTQGTSSGAQGTTVSSVYILNIPGIEMVDLMPVGRTELAKIADTVRFYINEYTVMAVKAEPFNAVLTNVSDPTS